MSKKIGVLSELKNQTPVLLIGSILINRCNYNTKKINRQNMLIIKVLVVMLSIRSLLLTLLTKVGYLHIYLICYSLIVYFCISGK